MNKTDGGPAYPCEQHETMDRGWNQTFEPGMSKLEAFAMASMQGDWASPSGNWPMTYGQQLARARLYYEMARAMIEAGEEATGDNDSL